MMHSFMHEASVRVSELNRQRDHPGSSRIFDTRNNSTSHLESNTHSEVHELVSMPVTRR